MFYYSQPTNILTVKGMSVSLGETSLLVVPSPTAST